MLLIRTTRQFRKSLKKLSRSGRFDQEEVGVVIDALARGEKLDASYSDHELSHEFSGNRECHIKPDLLLIYKVENNNLVLVLINLGSHSDLFD